MLTGLTDALKGLGAPLRALLIAVLGAALAWLWFSGKGVVAGGLAVAALVIGLVIDLIGRNAPLKRPGVKVEMMEWWIIVPMVIAALAAATAIVTAVELTVPDGVSPATKETVGALATAITAFLGSGFVDWAADSDDSKVSERIKAQFAADYQTTFTGGSEAELYVFAENHGGAAGWGRAARRIRADGIMSNWAADVLP